MATVITMPLLSDTMEEGTIAAWHKEIGDTLESGDLLVEIETDKAVMEKEIDNEEGVLLYIGVEAGGTIPVGAVLAIVGEKGESYEAALAAAQGGGNTTTTTTETPAVEEAVPVSTTTVETVVTTSDERIKASPLARKMAKEANINLATVKGTGENGRVVKRDIEALISQPKAPVAQPATTVAPQPTPQVQALPTPPPPPAPLFGMDGETHEDVRLSQMRKTIARRLASSKYSAPHFYLTVAINMDNVMPARKQMNAISPSKISFNDIVIKGVAVALKQHPAINASWLGDKIRYNKVYNIGVAVAVDEGLVVPVIRHADMKSLSQIAAEVKDKARKAQERKLSPDDMTGNTFTISNLGMFGIEEFTAIINPPDACILAVGGIKPTPVVENNDIKIANIMKVTLSCDHRVVDGATGAKFLQTLKGILEDPIRLLV